MQPFWALMAAAAGTIAIVPCAAYAHMFEADGVQVVHPWAEPSSTDRTRGFPTIVNDNGHAIVLTGVTAPVADAVSIIRHGAAIDRLEIGSGGITDPQTMHLEFTGLDQPLEEGDHFKATFRFAEGDPMVIDFVVGETTMMPAGMKH